MVGLYFFINDFNPLIWSICIWEIRTASISLGLIFNFSSSFSTYKEVVPKSINIFVLFAFILKKWYN